MIPRTYITEWKENAQWSDDAQVEQDLIIERALIAIYQDEFLANQLAFRGGTALHKLWLQPQVRYSEDIDLVQVTPAPIGDVLSRFRKVLSFIDGKITVDRGDSMTTMNYRYLTETEPIRKMKLKIEINCREHSSVLGYHQMPVSISNSWFTGQADIRTYQIEELLATKLRALYQRRKGRDLFDLWYAITNLNPDIASIIKTYQEYMKSEGRTIRRDDFISNMVNKMNDLEFRKDILGLLRMNTVYNPDIAFQLIRSEILEKI
jgi:predicted nucleotidyltransferase component of viral defense system